MTVLALAIFLVAVVYSSVGHGGASGYIAMVALLGHDPRPMATSALLLNLVVAGLAFFAFQRAGHHRWSLTWPFIAASVPAAVVGGWLPISRHTYYDLLAVVLFCAAVRLWLKPPAGDGSHGGPRLSIALLLGAGLGLISGIVGVGGGIFLSPIIILCRWADAKQTAATSAAFIFINSVAGLLGRLAAGRFEVGALAPLVVSAAVGGLIGSRLGATRVPNPWLCRILGAVLFMAAGKLVMT